MNQIMEWVLVGMMGVVMVVFLVACWFGGTR